VDFKCLPTSEKPQNMAKKKAKLNKTSKMTMYSKPRISVKLQVKRKGSRGPFKMKWIVQGISTKCRGKVSGKRVMQ
jgi:hypothetical protein